MNCLASPALNIWAKSCAASDAQGQILNSQQTKIDQLHVNWAPAAWKGAWGSMAATRQSSSGQWLQKIITGAELHALEGTAHPRGQHCRQQTTLETAEHFAKMQFILINWDITWITLISGEFISHIHPQNEFPPVHQSVFLCKYTGSVRVNYVNNLKVRDITCIWGIFVIDEKLTGVEGRR